MLVIRDESKILFDLCECMKCFCISNTWIYSYSTWHFCAIKEDFSFFFFSHSSEIGWNALGAHSSVEWHFASVISHIENRKMFINHVKYKNLSRVSTSLSIENPNSFRFDFQYIWFYFSFKFYFVLYWCPLIVEEILFLHRFHFNYHSVKFPLHRNGWPSKIDFT